MLNKIISTSFLFPLLILILVVFFLSGNSYNNNSIYAQQHTTIPPAEEVISLKITSHTTNQQVPAGPLTISGISSDTPSSNCLVSVIWNDLRPYHNAKATGPEGSGDFSTWSFTFDSSYHLIDLGENKLTSKISCFSPVGEKWYSINVTGVDSGNTTENTTENATTIISPSSQFPVSTSKISTLDNNITKTVIQQNITNTKNGKNPFMFPLSTTEKLPPLGKIQELKIKMNFDDKSISAGKEQNITITLKNSTNDPVEGVTIKGNISNGLIKKEFTVFSNENGTAVFSWRIPTDVYNGKYIVSIEASKNGFISVLNEKSFKVKGGLEKPDELKDDDD